MCADVFTAQIIARRDSFNDAIVLIGCECSSMIPAVLADDLFAELFVCYGSVRKIENPVNVLFMIIPTELCKGASTGKGKNSLLKCIENRLLYPICAPLDHGGLMQTHFFERPGYSNSIMGLCILPYMMVLAALSIGNSNHHWKQSSWSYFLIRSSYKKKKNISVLKMYSR